MLSLGAIGARAWDRRRKEWPENPLDAITRTPSTCTPIWSEMSIPCWPENTPRALLANTAASAVPSPPPTAWTGNTSRESSILNLRLTPRVQSVQGARVRLRRHRGASVRRCGLSRPVQRSEAIRTPKPTGPPAPRRVGRSLPRVHATDARQVDRTPAACARSVMVRVTTSLPQRNNPRPPRGRERLGRPFKTR